MSKHIIEDRYIGDGVYASFDGYHIVLDLRAQDTTKIALEPPVFAQLVQYERDVAAAIAKATEQDKTSEPVPASD